MNRYEVVIPFRVKKQIREIPLPWRERVGRMIELLEENPLLGEKMKGDFADRWKIRVWPYRVFYRIDKQIKIITLVAVKHRGSAGYK